MNVNVITAACCLLPLLASTVLGQPKGYNYDESKVPQYKLPDPLVMANGEQVQDADAWRKLRRPEIVTLFEQHVYGRAPEGPAPLRFEIFESDDQALKGTAIRKQVRVHLGSEGQQPSMDVLVYLPKNAKKPVPIFVGLNFQGNHAIHADPAIRLSDRWMRGGKGVVDHRATEEARGTSASRWAVDAILKRGYGLATIYCGDIDPDFHDEFQNGVHVISYKDGAERKLAADQWGTIAAWAWGLSRAVDYFEQDSDINAKQVAVIGHSRLGKTSLWAGARDERFALVISNNSGCGGAALSRRQFGETVKRINTSFPHWFCGNFKQYNDNVGALPVDQHMLIALIAPRPVYIASAVEDRWADPNGEFLSGRHADPVYRLLGVDGIGAKKQPPVDKPVAAGRIGYHIRQGKHDVTDFDWQHYLDFADRWIK